MIKNIVRQTRIRELRKKNENRPFICINIRKQEKTLTKSEDERGALASLTVKEKV